MKRRFALFCFCLSAVWPSTARAEPFTILPNGDVVWDTELTTRGVFRCQGPIPCSGSGTNTVMLGSGANQATITFTGVKSSFQVATRGKIVDIGRFDVVSTPGFTFPRRGNENSPVLRFGLVFDHTLPVPAEGRLGWLFAPGGRPELPIFMGIAPVALPLGATPPHTGYSAIIYTVRPFPFSLPSNGSLDLTANVGVAPEPGTLVLLSSGLGGLIMARRRRRRSTGSTSES